MIQSTLQTVSADVFMPALAPIVILAMLGTAGLVVSALIGAGIAAASRRTGLAKRLGAVALVAAVVYTETLLAAGLLSRDRTLLPGERKYMCEMDCHVAYAVTSVAAPDPTTRVVTVRSWFDPSTIAALRGNGPLTPNPRTVVLVDDAGRRYPPCPTALAGVGSTPLDTALRPGESYVTTFTFVLPPDARGARLFLGSPGGPESLLIGHENGPFHGRVYFALPEPRAAAR